MAPEITFILIGQWLLQMTFMNSDEGHTSELAGYIATFLNVKKMPWFTFEYM